MVPLDEPAPQCSSAVNADSVCWFDAHSATAEVKNDSSLEHAPFALSIAPEEHFGAGAPASTPHSGLTTVCQTFFTHANSLAPPLPDGHFPYAQMVLSTALSQLAPTFGGYSEQGTLASIPTGGGLVTPATGVQVYEPAADDPLPHDSFGANSVMSCPPDAQLASAFAKSLVSGSQAPLALPKYVLDPPGGTVAQQP